jgi:hypothetical protein
MMKRTLEAAERGVHSVLDGTARRELSGPMLAAVVFGCGACYGVVMGSYGGFRLWQMLFSGLKVPLLLLVTFAISLPSFFVLSTLLGVREDFAAARRAILRSQAALALVLAALAPYTALWYASTTAYDHAILFNALMFAVASFTAQAILRRSYRPLITRRPQQRQLLRIWLLLYVFVAVQMAWVLRPFIGDPESPTQFFRAGAWSNAYVVVARLIGGAFTP